MTCTFQTVPCTLTSTHDDTSICRHASFQNKAIAAHASSGEKQIAIVGGGIGGLTAARILQKHGFSPVVYEGERQQGARAQGGVLDLHPHSGEPLSSCDLMQVDCKG